MKKADWQNRLEKSFTLGKRIPFALPLNGKILDGNVIVRGTLSIGAEAGADGTAIGEGLLNIVKKIILRASKADGSRYADGPLVDLTARSIMRGAIFERGKFLGALTASADALAFKTGDYDIYISYPIYFAKPGLKRKIDTALNADETAYKSVELEVYTGTRDECCSGADHIWSFADLTVEWSDRREAADGDTYVLFQEDHLYTVNGAKERDNDGSLPTDGAFMNILFMPQKSAALTLADDILNKIELSGDTLDLKLKAADIRQAMYDQGYMDIDQTSTGLYLLNFCLDGMLTQVVPASRLSLKLDVANPSGAGLDTILIRTERVFAPDGYQPIQ